MQARAAQGDKKAREARYVAEKAVEQVVVERYWPGKAPKWVGEQSGGATVAASLTRQGRRRVRIPDRVAAGSVASLAWHTHVARLAFHCPPFTTRCSDASAVRWGPRLRYVALNEASNSDSFSPL